MRTIRSLVTVALIAPALVVVGASSVLACSCIPPRPDRVAVTEATAVFAGTMVDHDEDANIGFDPVTWRFAVDTVYKGDVSDLQEVTTHTQSAACGVVFEEQKRYVIFAHDATGDATYDDAELATNSCMNTRPVADGK